MVNANNTVLKEGGPESPAVGWKMPKRRAVNNAIVQPIYTAGRGICIFLCIFKPADNAQ